jgi:CubicO group peptidase (beta-lactamase class C family)
MIYKGKVVLHECFDEDRAYPVYSAAKSVTSMAFSLCCDDGLLSPQTVLSGLIDGEYKELFPTGFDKLPFQRFLTMTAGNFPFRPQGDDWLRYIFSLDTDLCDTSFHYSNIPAYLVGVACENAAGIPLAQYLQRRVFDPLGIAPPKFSTCPKGHFYGATGMETDVHSLALLGQLYLQNGEYGGKQLISKQSVGLAVSPHVFTGSDHYGYFFRIGDGCFSMVGKWGQRCIVYPAKGLVTAYLSDCPDRSQELFAAVDSFIRRQSTL